MKHKVLITITLILASLVMQAQNIIRPKVECPNGIYVNSYNGVLFYQRPDVSVSNRNMRLEAVFYYNSSSNKNNYGYGNGWSLGGELRYIEDSLGVIIEQGDGRRDMFTRYGNSFEAPAGVFSTLSIEGNGYLLTYKDGTKYYFADAQSKKVTLVKDRYDNTITYAYQDGNLATATDISGRSLNFTWADSLLVGLSTSFDDRTWSYQYDEKGNLTCVTDPMGYSVYYAYDKDNRIKTFTDAEGYSTHISYNVDGMAHRVKTDLTDKSIRYEIAKRQTIFIDYLPDANNQYSKYVWDEQGRLIEILNVNTGASTKFAYDDDNNLVRREDANGHAYTYTYDQNGNCLSATDPLGYTEYYTYESTFNNITTHIDKNNNMFSYSYDNKGNLLAANGPLNYSNQYTYNSFGQFLSIMDANNNGVYYSYDDYGNLSSFTDALGNITTFEYSQSWLLNHITFPNLGTFNLTYDNKGRLSSVTDQLNQTLGFQYDSKDQVVTKIDYKSNPMYYQYDALGHIVKITNAIGAEVGLSYNSNGFPVAFTDALNNKSLMFYDDQNRMIKRVDALGQETHYSYDNVGNVVGFTSPTGQIVNYEYDALGRVLAISDNFGIINSYAYDPYGNMVQHSDANGNVTTFVYNQLNRIVQRINSNGLSDFFYYDNAGNLLNVLDRNNNNCSFTYDAKNRLVSVIDALNHVTEYGYDVMDNMISITDANGNVTSFMFDLKGQNTQIDFANGTSRKYWYDGNGNMSKKQDEMGRQIEFSYDAINRLILCQYPDGSAYQYGYDLNNRLISAINEDATVLFSYDAVGRIVSETLNGSQTQYAYDIENRYVTMAYPNERVITKKYDSRLRLSDIYENNNCIASFTYNDDDTFASRSYANGVVSNYSYNSLQQLISLEDNAGIVSLQMSYDGMGNIINKKNFMNTDKSEAFSYDAKYQLIDYLSGEMNNNNQIINPNNSIHYSYDPVGNRNEVVCNGMTNQYAVNNRNSYTSIMGHDNIVMQYDANGNMINDGTSSLQYNFNNKLTSVDNGAVSSYKYDALHRRIQKHCFAGGIEKIINYYYSGHQIIEERDENNQTESSYLYGIWMDDIIQMKTSSQVFYYHQDGSNNVVAISDAIGAVAERYEYDPFGKVDFYNADNELIPQSSFNNTCLFAGRNYDSETGMYYYRARSLNASLGRFVQMDPLLFIDGTNLYSYVNNMPTRFIDPMGTNGYPQYGPGYNNNNFEYCGNSFDESPNYISVNARACLVAAAGACADVEIGWIYEGEDASLLPVVNIGVEGRIGVAAEASAGINAKYVSGRSDARERGISVVADVGIEAEVLGVGGEADYGYQFGIDAVEHSTIHKVSVEAGLGMINGSTNYDIENDEFDSSLGVGPVSAGEKSGISVDAKAKVGASGGIRVAFGI